MKFFKTVQGRLAILTISTAIGLVVLIFLAFASNMINKNHKNIYQELVALEGEIVSLKTIAIYEIDQKSLTRNTQ